MEPPPRMLNPALCSLVSLATTALGNTLEPIPALALVQPLALLLAFRGLCSVGPHRWFWATSLMAVLHAGAWTVAFGGLFSFNGWTASGLLTVFALGLLLWVPICFAAFLGSCFFRTRYPRSFLGALAFPCTLTAIYIAISLTPLSTMANPGYALLDLRPFALAASLCGIHGLNFVCAVSASALEGLICSSSSSSSSSSEDNDRPSSINVRNASWVGAAVFALACYGSAWGHIDTFYQRSIEETASKNVISVSCVLSPGNRPGMETGVMEDWMMEETKERVMAGDEIILWSEASVSVSNSTDEERLLRRAASVLHHQHQRSESVTMSTSKGSHQSSENISGSEAPAVGPYLGVAYFQAEEKRNMFVLLGPSGDPVWRYQKAHPVPFQMDGKPGSAVLPIAEAPGIGMIGGAICFDMDFPQYLRQAGAAGVNVLLQPSNTWGPIGDYHFRGNALRAVENGFTHVRCSSGGYSGVATPFYSFVQHSATLNNETLAFRVPVRSPVWTMYSHAGFLLEWAVVIAAVLISLLTFLPPVCIRRCLPEAAASWLKLGQSELLQRHHDSEPGETNNSSRDVDDPERQREPLMQRQ